MSDFEVRVLSLSALVACAAVAVVVPFAAGVGFLLARRRFRGKLLVQALVDGPLVLPPVVTGYLLLVLLGRNGVLGHYLDLLFGLRFTFHWTGAALASAVLAFPLAVRAIRVSVEGIPTRLEDAARSLGATPTAVFFRVTLPLALPGLGAAAVLAFARSLGEFGATMTFAGNVEGETQTLPLAIYSAMQEPRGEETVVRLVALSLALSIFALGFHEWWAERTARR